MSRVDCKSHPLPEAETLRDRFAMAALAGLIGRDRLRRGTTNEQAAAVAYSIADAMMEARK